MRYQIHCPVSKNDAIIIVIEHDCHATMFQCRSAQEMFSHVHHVKCDLDQDSFSTVRHHVLVLAVPRVVRCHSSDVCTTHHWKLRCKLRWVDTPKTPRIDHQLALLGLPLLSQIGTRLIFPIYRVPMFLAVFQ